jgi:hypothetical protein
MWEIPRPSAGHAGIVPLRCCFDVFSPAPPRILRSQRHAGSGVATPRSEYPLPIGIVDLDAEQRDEA